ncbi:aldehyde dehydrogenase [Methanococcus aeolicus Nankai-3]|uniref:Lactaldehyde dehydrogenase n=1 Tax=Methanococcus aeolicus (strain ATCC BAA-1280 / DSM 17508 / OCM 812 / Nankai-3) TaxID=419665 RepID=LADH_META3|nr:lactaldehyde dehydrogenase [Methanococcus aeolicus]A6UVT6.1 RecName: Full=Lactaldehyde dehydrogenase [Methanococcus aeolicus Nankai-3]ABR56608.1 aldehyde dehydrogenase [Methanococcus aeolicus Nankai-3]
MFINGEWINRKDIEVKNPYNNEIIGYIPSLSRNETKEAIKIAEEHKSTMKNLSPTIRYNILMKIASELSKNKRELAKLITIDVGKPIKQSIIEVDRTITTFKFSAFYSRELRGETIPFDDGMVITKREPVGLVGAITPFNFPLNLFAHKIAPAIAMGNSIVAHPSSKAPMITIELTKIIEKVLKSKKIPLGVFNLLTGEGHIVGDEIVKNNKINKLSFTGSVEVGESITKKAGFKKITLELGGNNPMIILKDANINKAVESCMSGKFLNSGQVCISVGRVLIEQEVADEFINKIVEKVKKLKIGNPLDEDTNISSLISLDSAERVEKLINKSIGQGGKLICGGKRENSIIYPTILEITADNILANIEIFAPVLPIIRVNDMNEALNQANNSNYGLHSGVFTQDINKALYFADNLEYGGVLINNSPTFRIDNMPFGGIKHSGLGREGIKYAIDEMSEIKTIIVNTK